MKICTNCSLEGNGKFCTRCGSPMIDMESRNMNNDQHFAQTIPAVPANAAADQFAVPYYAPAMNYPYGIPPEYQPISMWGYFGYAVLFSIPLIGWVIALIYALGGTSNINVRNYARSFFCIAIIVAVLITVFFGSTLITIMSYLS